ncbi:carbohydrate kinase family protein [Leifsonia aquatica]|uniref:carbohydrate kinase family protein n=1 Tax=Leifsonia aquatica TaxID=144185 RepID=UPI0038147BE8
MLAVVGDLVEDIVVWPSGALRRGTDNQAEIYRTRGGSAANVAAFAAGLHPTRFIGCVGDDATGENLGRVLSESGVDVRVQRRGTTGTIVILIEPDGERTMLPNRGAATKLERVADAWLDGVELLHIPAYSFDGDPVRQSVEAMIDVVRGRGGLISVDASSTQVIETFGVQRFRDYLERIAPDFLIANGDEAELLGFGSADATAENLRRNPSTTFVLKAGAQPTRVLSAHAEPLTVDVPPVTVIRDSTGAGDAFAAGFLTTYLTRRDLVASCRGGHRSAQAVLGSPGATTPIPVVGASTPGAPAPSARTKQ